MPRPTVIVPSSVRTRIPSRRARSLSRPCLSKSPSLAIRFVLMIAVLSLLQPRPSAQDSAPAEYQIKAAFLYNFAKFVDWPAGAFPNPQAPFAICILGTDPFGSAIDSLLRGKTVGEHPVVIQRSREPSEVRHCQIVFVSASEKRRLPEIIASLQKANVLIVGDTDHFADSGGTIQLILEEDHVRFAVNVDAADGAGLKISSKLLALARIVHGTEGERN